MRGYRANMCGSDLRWDAHGHDACRFNSYTVTDTEMTGAAQIDNYSLSGTAIADKNSGRLYFGNGREHSHTIHLNCNICAANKGCSRRRKDDAE